MMIKTIAVLLAGVSTASAVENGAFEFGQFRVVKGATAQLGYKPNHRLVRREKKALKKKSKRSTLPKDGEGEGEFPWLDLSLSMSWSETDKPNDMLPWMDLSMSMNYPTPSFTFPPAWFGGPTAPPTIAQTPVPTTAPSTSASPTGSSSPICLPTVSLAPTASSPPSMAPTSSSAPSTSSLPSTAPTSSSAPTTSTLPSTSPSCRPTAAPTASSPPSMAPTSSSAPSTSSLPSTAPTSSSAPTTSTLPSTFPTATSRPSCVPSSAPTPTLFQEKVVFTCTDNGVDTVEPPFQVATVIDIQVVYVVETLAFFNEFQEDLEDQIVAAAVIGALQCDAGGPLFGPGGTAPPVLTFTALTGEACTPTLDNTICTVFATEFQIVVEEDLDPDVAAILAYAMVREEMNSGAMVAAVPVVDRIEYLRPILPDLPPIEAPEVPGGGLDAEPQGSITVSPWTIGAVMAMCFGGVMALVVWARNRKTRHRRHVQLLEDMSLASPAAA